VWFLTGWHLEQERHTHVQCLHHWALIAESSSDLLMAAVLCVAVLCCIQVEPLWPRAHPGLAGGWPGAQVRGAACMQPELAR
jgi:hypothetical protein